MSYPVSADITTVMRWQRDQGMRRLGEATLAEARRNRSAINKLLPVTKAPNTLATCTIDIATGSIPLLIAQPRTPSRQTGQLLLYIHGGGWSVGQAIDYSALIQALADATCTPVAAPDFALAPEHPFPYALHQIDAIIESLQTQALSGLPQANELILIGDSSGGNLCASAALHAARAGRPVQAQILIYPAIDPADPLTDAAQDMPALTPAALQWFLDLYVSEVSQREDPRISPARDPDLALSPPTLLITAEHDILNPQIDRYEASLRKYNTPVLHHRIPGSIHTFIQLPGVLASANLAIELIAGNLDYIRRDV